MKRWSVLFLALLLLPVLAGCDAEASTPFKELRAEDIASVDIVLTPPSTTFTVSDPTDIAELTALLHDVVLYEQDDSGRETADQLVSFRLIKTDGNTVTVGAYGNYMYLNDVCYKAKYEPSEALNAFGNSLYKQLSNNGTPPDESTPPVTTDPNAPPVEAEPRFVVASEEYNETFLADNGSTVLLYASYAMPLVTVVGDESASDAINTVLKEMRESFLHSPSEYEIGVDSALASAKLIAEEGYNGEPFAMEQTFSITRADGAVLSIFNEYYSYLGGAHPNTVMSGICFNAKGSRVSLDDLSDDREGFKAFCAEKITALAEAGDDGRYSGDYKELIPYNIRDDMWYFSAEGLTFIYNAYDIGPYAAGAFEFIIPYAELKGVIDDRWLPAVTDDDGVMTCEFAEKAGTYEPLFEMETDEDGAVMIFSSKGTVRNVWLYHAAYNGEKYEENGLIAFISRMDDGECFSLKYLFPGEMSCLGIRYTAEGTKQITRFIQLSGEDGSILMLEQER